jgi:hypothetical protein
MTRRPNSASHCAVALLLLLPAILVEADETTNPGRITLRWRTASEQDNLGFNLYRSDSQDGPWTRINQELIPGQGTTSQVHQYEYVDQPVERFRPYYYYLESISTQGVAERYSGTIIGIDDRTILGSARPGGDWDLPLALRSKDQTLSPGRYQIVLQQVEKEAALVNDIGDPEAGRARYVRENVTHILLQRDGATMADELAIAVAEGQRGQGVEGSTGRGIKGIEGVLLRPDQPPPAGEPRRLYRLTVRDGDRILRAFFEPAS